MQPQRKPETRHHLHVVAQDETAAREPDEPARPTLAEYRAKAGSVFRCPTCGSKRGVYYTRERMDHKLRCYTCLDCKTKLWTKETVFTSEGG